MVGAQREATRPRLAGPDSAAARVRVAYLRVLPCVLLFAPLGSAWGQPGPAHKPAARDAHGAPAKAGHPVVLPAHRRGDTGKPADTTKLHDISKIEDATTGAVSEERKVVPIAPAPAAPAPAAPPEGPVVPAETPDTPTASPVSSEEKTAPTAEDTAAIAAKLAAAAAKLAATAARLAATAEKLAAAAQANAAKPGRPAPGESPTAAGPPRESTTPSESAAAREPTPPPKAEPVLPGKPEAVTLDEAVLDQIRLEIKSRLPYFQACADASRRRGSSEVRRVTATWTIAADGAIKEMKVDGVPDPLLATCITRMGSHAFTVQPGTELTIPAPILFVR